MAQLPWFFAPDHLPDSGATSSIRALALGDGGLSGFSGSSQIQIIDDATIGKAVTCTSGSDGYYEKQIPETSELTMGWRRVIVKTSVSSRTLLEMRNSNGEILNLFYTSARTVQVRRGTTVLAESTTSLQANTVNYIEFYVKFNDTVGAFELRINGASEASGSGVDTANVAGGCTFVRWFGVAGTATDSSRDRDHYIRTSSGAQFYGPIQLVPIRPDGDIETTFGTTTGTDHYTEIDEEETDSDTSYVESNTVGERVVTTVGDLTPSGSIVGVVVVTVGSAPNGGAPAVKHLISDGTNEQQSDDVALSDTTFGTQARAFMTAPDAGAWTSAKVDALRIGVEAT